MSPESQTPGGVRRSEFVEGQYHDENLVWSFSHASSPMTPWRPHVSQFEHFETPTELKVELVVWKHAHQVSKALPPCAAGLRNNNHRVETKVLF